MIRIIKPAKPPEVLFEKGMKRRSTHCRNYTLYAADYDSGIKTLRFAHEIYGDPSVWETLIAAQHGKCCFCERAVGQGGDVEHFRPKGSCRQTNDDVVLLPGYYWLAYDWDNLLLSCKECNQLFKGSQFPLLHPNDRARTHHDDLSKEQPLLIHPCRDDPERYIGFRGIVAYAVNDDIRAETSIQVLGLDEAALRRDRFKRLNYLLTMKQIIDLEAELSGTPEGRTLVKKARAELFKAITDEAEFASAARCAIATEFRYLPSKMSEQRSEIQTPGG